nr:pyruvate formate lyase family protein [Geotalea toluenoxydans]
MRQDFLNAPKWGNDDDYADGIIKDFYEDIIGGEMAKITNYSGGPVLPVGQAVGLYMEIAPGPALLPMADSEARLVMTAEFLLIWARTRKARLPY